MNLAQAIHRVYSELRLNKITEQTPHYTEVIELLNEGTREVYRQCANEHVPVEISTANVSTVSNTATYSISSNLTNILGKKILRIRYLNSSTEEGIPLSFKSKDAIFGLGSDPESTLHTDKPRFWYIEDGGASWGVYPVPNSSVTNSMKIWFAVVPTEVSEYWGVPVTTTLTANVTNASNSVVVSSNAIGNVTANSEFGIISTEQSVPAAWYTVASTPTGNGLTLTLSSTYSGSTATLQKFVTSKTITLGDNHPSLSRAIVYYAVYHVLNSYNPQKASIYYSPDNPNNLFDKTVRKLIKDLKSDPTMRDATIHP